MFTISSATSSSLCTDVSINRLSVRYRLFEALPGLLSWGLIAVMAAVVCCDTGLFALLMLLFMAYWITSAMGIVVSARRGLARITWVRETDWIARLDAEFPHWRDFYYLTLIPFASESIRVLRPTLASLAASDFPTERKILVLSSEAAIPGGRAVAEELAAEFAGCFGRILVTEHTLRPGELKGKASNENHAGRFAYDALSKLGLDPERVLLSSNDADMQVERAYPAYLLHSYLSEGPQRDHTIYQPIPADLGDYWNASFFTRMLVMSGILWRIRLQVREGPRCTVFAFYSMSLKTLRDLGFWDADVIPEDERTMFKAIAAFGPSFRVRPLFVMARGASIRGDGLAGSAVEQYAQIRRWAWGASEIANSLSTYRCLDRSARRAMVLPILNQLRSAVEWSLAPLLLVFGGFLPGLVNPAFILTPSGQIYAFAMTAIAAVSTALLLCTIALETIVAPPRPAAKRGFPRQLFGFAQWFLTPAVSLAFGALPALEAQTRLILNRRIAYVESRKE